MQIFAKSINKIIVKSSKVLSIRRLPNIFKVNLPINIVQCLKKKEKPIIILIVQKNTGYSVVSIMLKLRKKLRFFLIIINVFLTCDIDSISEILSTYLKSQNIHVYCSTYIFYSNQILIRAIRPKSLSEIMYQV